MSTMTATRRSVKFECSLTLTVNGTAYNATPFKAEDPEIGRCVRLEKRDGTTYDVAEGPHGPECSCPDWVARHADHNTAGCKHIRGCVQFGLIAPRKAPAPRPSIPGVTRVRDEFDEPAPSEAPSDRDRAAARAFGIRLPAKGGQQAPAPVACCDSAEASAPCKACLTSAPVAVVEPEPAPADEPTPDAPDGPPPGDRGDDGRRLDLAEWLDEQSRAYARLDTQAGDLLAHHIATLARSVRAVMTPGVAWITPAEAEARMEALATA